jgi:hypothetical protein
VKPGLNIHGLRHSLGSELYDLGLEREARKAVMAHESDAASRIYERGGNRSIHADRAVRALNRKHNASGTECVEHMHIDGDVLRTRTERARCLTRATQGV